MRKHIIRTVLAVMLLAVLTFTAVAAANAEMLSTESKLELIKKLKEETGVILPKLKETEEKAEIKTPGKIKDVDIDILLPKMDIGSDGKKESESKKENDGKLRITKQPTDCTVKKGGKAKFGAKCEGDTGITWRFVDPEGDEILAKDIGRIFKGVSVTGKNSDNITIKKVPEEMHGWAVYCTYSNKKTSKNTQLAYIWIKGMDKEVPAAKDDDYGDEAGDDAPAFAYTGSDTLTVTVVGADLEADGADGDTIDFSGKGTADFKVSCKKTPAYWVINGARYDFTKIPKAITVRDLTYPMTIEAVMKGAKPKTLLSDEQLQAKRTGETLLATDKNADMCFVTSSGKGKGGWFDEFDFTDDFKNKATGKREDGGRVTLRCKAYMKKGDKVLYWKFNDAKLYFSTQVTEFVVKNLNETMEYHPITEKGKTPEKKEEKKEDDRLDTDSVINVTVTNPGKAPDNGGTVNWTVVQPETVMMCRVSCTGCTFSGGGNSGASSGSVPKGTQITVKKNGGKVKSWKVNGSIRTKKEKVSMPTGRRLDDRPKLTSVTVPVTTDTITVTVNADTTVVCVTE